MIIKKPDLGCYLIGNEEQDVSAWWREKLNKMHECAMCEMKEVHLL